MGFHEPGLDRRDHGGESSVISDAIRLIFLVLAWIGIAVRFYVRGCITKKFGTDDWFMLAGALAYSLASGFYFATIANGSGKHNWQLTTQQKVKAMEFWYHCEWSYVATTTFIKIAFAVFYLPFAVEIWQKRLLKFLIVIVTVFDTAWTACVIFQCWPVPHTWTRWAGTKGSCVPDSAVLIASYGTSAVMSGIDFTLVLLPIAMLWNSMLGWKEKLSIMFLLSLGGLASISILIRFKYIYAITDWNDWFYTTSPLGRLSSIEPGLALLAGGLAVSRPLFRRLSPNSCITSQRGKTGTKPTRRSFRQKLSMSSVKEGRLGGMGVPAFIGASVASAGSKRVDSGIASGEGPWHELPGKDLGFSGSPGNGSRGHSENMFGARRSTNGMKMGKWGLGLSTGGTTIVTTGGLDEREEEDYLGFAGKKGGAGRCGSKSSCEGDGGNQGGKGRKKRDGRDYMNRWKRDKTKDKNSDGKGAADGTTEGMMRITMTRTVTVTETERGSEEDDDYQQAMMMFRDGKGYGF